MAPIGYFGARPGSKFMKKTWSQKSCVRFGVFQIARQQNCVRDWMTGTIVNNDILVNRKTKFIKLAPAVKGWTTGILQVSINDEICWVERQNWINSHLWWKAGRLGSSSLVKRRHLIWQRDEVQRSTPRSRCSTKQLAWTLKEFKFWWRKTYFVRSALEFTAYFLAWRHEIKLISFFLIFNVFFCIILEHLNDSAAAYDGPLLALIAKLLSEKPLGLPADWPRFRRGSTVRQPGALTTGYTTTPLSCATPYTELWHTPYWASPHPILSYATSHTELRHTLYWAMPHPIQSYATPHTELCHTLCMYVSWRAGTTTLFLLGS